MNRRGMTALVDAMVFMVVMMMVVSLSVYQVTANSDPGADAGEMMDSLCGVQVRISDMSSLDDDSLVYLTDLMAVHTTNPNADLVSYLESVLDKQSGGRAYMLTMGYGGKTGTVGSDFPNESSSSHRELPVSIGGTLVLDIRVSS